MRDTDTSLNYGKFDDSAGSKTFDVNSGASIATFTNGAVALDSNNDGGIFRVDTYSFYGLWEKNLGSNRYRVWGGHAGSEFTTNPASHVSSATYSGYSFGLLTEIGLAQFHKKLHCKCQLRFGFYFGKCHRHTGCVGCYR